MNWTGGAVRDLLSSDGRRLGRFNGKSVDVLPGVPVTEAGKANCVMTADLVGDYRDEIVCTSENKLLVFSNMEPGTRREVTRTASREYRQWMARNMGGGYPSYFEWEP